MCGGVWRWVSQEQPFTEIVGEAGVVAGAASAGAGLRFGHRGSDS